MPFAPPSLASQAEAHMLGTVLRQLGNLEAALPEFRETIKHQPSYAEAHLNLGEALLRKQDRAGGADAFAMAESLNPSLKNRPPWVSLSQMLRNKRV